MVSSLLYEALLKRILRLMFLSGRPNCAKGSLLDSLLYKRCRVGGVYATLSAFYS